MKAASPGETAALIALASVEGIGPSTILTWHRGVGGVEALRRLRNGRFGDLPEFFKRFPTDRSRDQAMRAAREIDESELFERSTSDGRRVLVIDRVGYPDVFGIEDPPPILFLQGDHLLMTAPSVAVIGTRNATRAGREVASQLGRDLSRAGLHVVSGLALGIDGAAHTGLLDQLADAADADADELGRPVGVIASGLDVTYPPRHARLHEQVAEHGLLLSETPLGFRPSRWRFPARNRIIAALSRAVVVVESRLKGGSITTVDEALKRNADVLCMPGHPLAPASAGTNQLIRDGAILVRDADDVMAEIGWEPPRPVETSTDRSDGASGATMPEGVGSVVVEALAEGPASLGELLLATGVPMDDLSAALVRLEGTGHVVDTGGWFELRARGMAAVTGGRSR